MTNGRGGRRGDDLHGGGGAWLRGQAVPKNMKINRNISDTEGAEDTEVPEIKCYPSNFASFKHFQPAFFKL